MSGPKTTEDEKTISKRAAESLVYKFDYDDWLAADVELASVGTFTLFPSDGHLTSDNPTLVSGSRSVTVRLLGGKVGKTYRVEHTAATNESPAQTPAKYVDLFIKP
jgi:hypothetical protein